MDKISTSFNTVNKLRENRVKDQEEMEREIRLTGDRFLKMFDKLEMEVPGKVMQSLKKKIKLLMIQRMN
ncbi:MAG: hypothetical protein QNK30_15550 [Bacteroidales bacterium]|nr:hypothetical protein [Bacteroidales bacterium]